MLWKLVSYGAIMFKVGEIVHYKDDDTNLVFGVLVPLNFEYMSIRYIYSRNHLSHDHINVKINDMHLSWEKV